MGKKRNLTKNPEFWGNFLSLFSLPLNLAAISMIAMKNHNNFFADFVWPVHRYILIVFILYLQFKYIFLQHPNVYVQFFFGIFCMVSLFLTPLWLPWMLNRKSPRNNSNHNHNHPQKIMQLWTLAKRILYFLFSPKIQQ